LELKNKTCSVFSIGSEKAEKERFEIMLSVIFERAYYNCPKRQVAIARKMTSQNRFFLGNESVSSQSYSLPPQILQLLCL
jgi:hypothetical protein